MRQLICALFLLLSMATPARAQENHFHSSPNSAPRQGRSQFITTVLAVGAIVVAGGAGLFIYRGIKKGL